MNEYTCPPDHAHGASITCHSKHGCRCGGCKANRSEYDRMRRVLRGQGFHVPADATMRRLRALARHGWGAKRVALGAGVALGPLTDVRLGNQKSVQSKTERAVAAFYARHAMEVLHGRAENRLKNSALRAGWLSPLEWDDIEQGIADELALQPAKV